MKNEFAKKFKDNFPGKRLLAIQLDGFSHRVVFDNGTKNSDIVYLEYSNYMSPSERSDKGPLANLFKGVGHASYQNNAKEILYVRPEDR